MAGMHTEALHECSSGLDMLPASSVLGLLAEGQIEAAKAVRNAIPEIARAASMLAECLSAGGRIAYAAAGSSALMALADALELPGTFGISRDRIVLLTAGGDGALDSLAGGPEDDAVEAARRVAAAGLGAGDCLVAVSASGTTPYASGALEEAARRGAKTVGIANNRETPLLMKADAAVLLATPPELIAGSTRMGAGTAQKIALNMLSTLTAIHLGHVHDGYMVDVRTDNLKLRARAARIVSAIGGCREAKALSLLDRTGGAVKPAVLLAAGAATLESALELLDGTGHNLRSALSRLQGAEAPAKAEPDNRSTGRMT
jgi:N-acetylmuramic acid 6-phosphate etherase